MDPAVADSLQAVQDTVVIVQAQSTSWLEWASFVVSLFIAGFTGGYLYYTTKIFQKTKKQAEAATDASEASLESNTIQKRANFYPTFDIRLKSNGENFQKLEVTLTPLDGSILQKGYLYGLLGYEPGTAIGTDFSSHVFFWRSVGNVVSERTVNVDAGRPITSATFLLRFSDPLGNVYYRFQSFHISVEDDKLIARHTATVTNQMVPTEMYHHVLSGEGIYFAPVSSNTGESDVENFEEVQDDCPRPIKVFNAYVYAHADGTLDEVTSKT